MTDSVSQKDAALEGRASPNEIGRENIVIRTMEDDLRGPSAPALKEEKPVSAPVVSPFLSKEAEFKGHEFRPAPVAPITKSPALSPFVMPPVPSAKVPAKEFPEIPARPIFKATPVWMKLGAIAFGVIVLVLLGLYSYWKIFIQSEPAIPPPAVTTPSLPIAGTATTTAPIAFFNKLPHKTVTLDLPSKISPALLNALESEITVEEKISSVKQVKITYQGKPLSTEEFVQLMQISTPPDFLNNYEDEFALAFFKQKEGIRPILILKSKDENLAKSRMEAWEKTDFASDIFPLFLTDAKLPANLPPFRTYLFVNQQVRYLNIGTPFASLNYSFYNNFLVITASSAGMFVVLQDLTGQAVSLEYLKYLESSINRFVDN